MGGCGGEVFGGDQGDDLVALVRDEADAEVSMSVEGIDVFGFFALDEGALEAARAAVVGGVDMLCGAEEGFATANGLEFVEVLFGFVVDGVESFLVIDEENGFLDVIECGFGDGRSGPFFGGSGWGVGVVVRHGCSRGAYGKSRWVGGLGEGGAEEEGVRYVPPKDHRPPVGVWGARWKRAKIEVDRGAHRSLLGVGVIVVRER